MPEMPRDSSLDASIALYRSGYLFISDRCRALHTDVFETRLLLKPAICFLGAEAARVFYDTEHMRRQGAMPRRIQKALIGQGGVQGLDGMAHRQRKEMLMALMLPERIEQFGEIARQEWHGALQRWRRAERVILLDEAHEVFCRAVCRWSGVPLPSGEVRLRTADFAAMVDGGGAIGPRHWRSRLARVRAGRWAEELIRRTRAGEIEPEPDSALAVIAYHRDVNGRLLEPRAGAVDLLNVLRPTVAVGTYVTFAALALHRFPESRPTFVPGSLDLQHFVNEVRRYFPFFPFQAAVVGKSFEWRGFRFPKGRRVLLDLYGTDHDERLWDAPYEFRPERFEIRDTDAFALIPQGGGDHYVHHRCAGEWVTLTLLKGAVEFLEREAHYRVPEQDLSVDLSRMPAMPKSGFVIEALPPGGAGKRGQAPVSGTGAATAPQKPH
jgi:fatty-acid peroxygenase